MKVKQVVLVCDTCGSEDDVVTRRAPLVARQGEACPACWKAIEEAAAYLKAATAKWRR